MEQTNEGRQLSEEMRQKYEACTKSSKLFHQSLGIWKEGIYLNRKKLTNEEIPCRKCPFYTWESVKGSASHTTPSGKTETFTSGKRIMHNCSKHGYLDTVETSEYG